MSGLSGLGLIDGLLMAFDQAPVILGQVVFEGHEVPSRISVGGAQAVTIHKLPGGGRIIDAMGVDNGAITWRGFFTGPFAAARARLVDAMRQSGQLVGLSFSDYAFNVVVVHFEYDLQDRGALISYRIRTEIVPDPAVLEDDTAAGVAASLSSDIASAIVSVAGFGLAAARTALAGVQTSLALPGEPDSTIKLAAVGVALQAGGNALQTGILASGSLLPTAAGSGDLGLSTAAGLSGSVAAAGSLAAGVQAAGYVNRSGNWLGQLAGQSQGAPLIQA